MDRRKLQRLGDEIVKLGCTAYLWYREKTAPKTYGPYLTYEQRRELMKWPIRKRWDAFYYRHMGWIYRKSDESLVQYFKRGFPLLFFLTYRDLTPLTERKKLLPFLIFTSLAAILFPFWMFGANEATPLAVLFVGESAAPMVFSLHVWALLIGGGVTAGIMAPTVVKECRDELRAGKSVWQVFGPPMWAVYLLTWPVSLPVYCVRRAYRYDRRFYLLPITMFARPLTKLGARYRKAEREEI